MSPYCFRQQDKRRYQENEAAQESQHGGVAHFLQTLVIAYHSEVENEEHECRGKIRESFDGHPCRRIFCIYEKPYKDVREQRERSREHHTADHCREKRYPLRSPDSVSVPETEVVADDRLGRLGYGVSHHEHERGIVAGYAECSHAIVTKVFHEHMVAHEHKYGHRRLSQQCGRADAALIAQIPE